MTSSSLPNRPRRRRPAGGVLSPGDDAPIVVDTICTQGRERWLASDMIHDLLRRVWMDAKAWLVGRYVIMPDHIHYFAAPGELPVSYDNWVQYWKSQFVKRYRCEQGDPPPGRWQSNSWDWRLRSFESYEQKWEYVKNNPVRAGLVSSSDDWPFQGELNEFRWD